MQAGWNVVGAAWPLLVALVLASAVARRRQW